MTESGWMDFRYKCPLLNSYNSDCSAKENGFSKQCLYLSCPFFVFKEFCDTIKGIETEKAMEGKSWNKN